jgi:hypothetical protein
MTGKIITKASMRGVVSVSLTPGFSRVFDSLLVGNRFSGFPARIKTVKTVPDFGRLRFTGLKPGVNEMKN